jgi:hypothetical protein
VLQSGGYEEGSWWAGEDQYMFPHLDRGSEAAGSRCASVCTHNGARQGWALGGAVAGAGVVVAEGGQLQAQRPVPTLPT